MGADGGLSRSRRRSPDDRHELVHARLDKPQHLMRIHAAELGGSVHRRGQLAVRPDNKLRRLHNTPTSALSYPAAQRFDELGVYAMGHRERKLMVVGRCSRFGDTLRIARDYTYSQLKELAIALLDLGQLPSAVRSPSASVKEQVDPRSGQVRRNRDLTASHQRETDLRECVTRQQHAHVPFRSFRH